MEQTATIPLSRGRGAANHLGTVHPCDLLFQVRHPVPACFLGGPGSVQLDDGTIFTFYSLPRFAGPKKGDVIDQEKFILDRSFHQYIAGSRYTEDFRSAPPPFRRPSA